jgi:putative oxidoreductase
VGVGFLNKLQPLGLLVLRVVVGIIMAAHGWQKIHGGPSHFVQTVSGLGLPGWMAYLTITAEFLGGILLIVGLGTRIAAAAILIDMLVAITKVHLHNGLLAQGGYQFPLTLAAAAFALIFFGAGALSVDWMIGARRK